MRKKNYSQYVIELYEVIFLLIEKTALLVGTKDFALIPRGYHRRDKACLKFAATSY